MPGPAGGARTATALCSLFPASAAAPQREAPLPPGGRLLQGHQPRRPHHLPRARHLHQLRLRRLLLARRVRRGAWGGLRVQRQGGTHAAPLQAGGWCDSPALSQGPASRPRLPCPLLPPMPLQAPAQPPSGTKTVKVAQVCERVCAPCVLSGPRRPLPWHAPACLHTCCPDPGNSSSSSSSGSAAESTLHCCAQPAPPARPQVSLTSHLEKLSMADWTLAAQNQFKGHLAGAVKGMNVGGGGGGRG